MKILHRPGRTLAWAALFASVLAMLTACFGVSTPATIHYLTDSQGRALILHGINTGDAKHTADGTSGDSPDFIQRQAQVYGFNVVRFLVFWKRIEPQQGVYDTAYLDAVQARVKQYTDQGMYVLIDFHQDLYGPCLDVTPDPADNDGAPCWATDTNGLTPQYQPLSKIDWSFQNLDPAMLAAQRNFWQYGRDAYFQDHFIAAQQEVAKRFVGNPGVIGYDLYNEPIGGDIGQLIDGSFQSGQLTAYYNRAIPKLREIEPDKYIFFEPQSLGPNFGMPAGLQQIKDTRAGDSRVVYAPHLYPLNISGGGAYNDIDRQQMSDWSANRAKDLNLHQSPLVTGELGGPESATQGQYLDDAFGALDTMGSGWMWWDNGKGSWGIEDSTGHTYPKAEHIVRTYPRAIAGAPESFGYNPMSAEFTLSFQQKAGVTGPTEIFVATRHYPNGWVVDVSDTPGTWSTSYNPATQVLSVWTNPNQTEHTIRVHRTLENIYATHLGKCLGTDYGKTANSTRAVVWDCGSQADQTWSVMGDGTIQSAKAPGQCLDANGASSSNSTAVQLYQCNGGNNQKWSWDVNGQLHSAMNANKCLDVAYGGSSTVMQIWDCLPPGTASQTFEQRAVTTSQYVAFSNQASGTCLNINGGAMQNGTNVILWPCDTNSNSGWRVDAKSGHVHSQKDPTYCLSNGGNAVAAGAPWTIARCDATQNTQFYWNGSTLRPYTNAQLVMQADATSNASLIHQQAGDGTAPLSAWVSKPH